MDKHCQVNCKGCKKQTSKFVMCLNCNSCICEDCLFNHFETHENVIINCPSFVVAELKEKVTSLKNTINQEYNGLVKAESKTLLTKVEYQKKKMLTEIQNISKKISQFESIIVSNFKSLEDKLTKEKSEITYSVSENIKTTFNKIMEDFDKYLILIDDDTKIEQFLPQFQNLQVIEDKLSKLILEEKELSLSAIEAGKNNEIIISDTLERLNLNRIIELINEYEEKNNKALNQMINNEDVIMKEKSTIKEDNIIQKEKKEEKNQNAIKAANEIEEGELTLENSKESQIIEKKKEVQANYIVSFKYNAKNKEENVTVYDVDREEKKTINLKSECFIECKKAEFPKYNIKSVDIGNNTLIVTGGTKNNEESNKVFKIVIDSEGESVKIYPLANMNIKRLSPNLLFLPKRNEIIAISGNTKQCELLSLSEEKSTWKVLDAELSEVRNNAATFVINSERIFCVGGFSNSLNDFVDSYEILDLSSVKKGWLTGTATSEFMKGSHSGLISYNHHKTDFVLLLGGKPKENSRSCLILKIPNYINDIMDVEKKSNILSSNTFFCCNCLKKKNDKEWIGFDNSGNLIMYNTSKIQTTIVKK